MNDNGELVGWKEIAACLEVDPKTATRWEKTLGLPVRRSPSGRPVALRDELEAWKSSRGQRTVAEPATVSARDRRKLLWIAALVSVITVTVLLAWLVRKAPAPQLPSPATPPRLFWRNGGQAPDPFTRLPFTPYGLVLTGSEDKLLALAFDSPEMAVIDTRTLSVQRIRLPLNIQRGRLAPDGRTLLVSSTTDGFLLFDTDTQRVKTGPISTGGTVSDLVMTNDGRKVFLAMRGHGLKRWSAGSGRLDVVTTQQSPWFLGLDDIGDRLFVSYQGGGPKGRPGHDSVEMFNTDSERSIGFLPDLPLVGSAVEFSPNRQWMIIDGADACRNSVYDRLGCPESPANVLHIFRMPDVSLLKSVALSLDAAGSGTFLGNTNALLMVGPAQGAPSTHSRGLSVFDLSFSGFLEKLNSLEQIQATVASPTRRKVFAATFERSIMAFDFEPLDCGIDPAMVQLRLTGDGVASGLKPGGWIFEPGLVGQSFRFQGKAGASFSSFGRTFGPVDSGLAVYVKPAQTGSRQVFLELRHAPNPEEFWTLALTEDSRAELRLATLGHQPVVIHSSTRAEVGRWMLLTIGRDANGVEFYVDGKLESRVSAERLGEFRNGAPVAVGGVTGAYFDGWIDEIAFLGRTPSRSEVSKWYQERLAGPCKP